MTQDEAATILAEIAKRDTEGDDLLRRAIPALLAADSKGSPVSQELLLIARGQAKYPYTWEDRCIVADQFVQLKVAPSINVELLHELATDKDAKVRRYGIAIATHLTKKQKRQFRPVAEGCLKDEADGVRSAARAFLAALDTLERKAP